MRQSQSVSVIPASKCEGFVLVGGASSRMGMPKAGLHYQNRTFLELALAVFRGIGIHVSVVASAEQRFPNLDVDVPVLTDRLPGVGPLGGIHTALFSSSLEWCFFLPCDVPFMDRRLPELLYSGTPDSDIVVPVDSAGRLHPLCACYSNRCLPMVEDRLNRGKRKVRELLSSNDLRVTAIRVAEHGLPDRLLTNVNTLAEFHRL